MRGRMNICFIAGDCRAWEVAKLLERVEQSILPDS